MKKQKLAAVILLFAVLFIPRIAYAASANVYVSPASSAITTGDNVTLTVRINSGSDSYTTAAARLNFDSTKLQYVSYSAGSFTTITATPGSNYFEYEGFVIGGTAGDVKLFSVTLKSIAAGTANITLSGVTVVNSGIRHTETTSGASVTISDPVQPSTPSGETTSTPKKSTTVSQPAVDKTAPSLVGEPAFEKEQKTIKVTFNTNEAAFVKLFYGLDGEAKKEISVTDPKTNHEFLIGQDSSLVPGKIYTVELSMTDQAGNSAKIQSWQVRTKGVQFKIRLTDSEGKPVANQSIQLFSDPLNGTTDADGNVTFDDVPVGEHTLVTEFDGVTVRKPVQVTGEQAADEKTNITLPFSIGKTAQAASRSYLPLLLLGSFFLGVAVMKLPLKNILSKVTGKLKKHTSNTLPPTIKPSV